MSDLIVKYTPHGVNNHYTRVQTEFDGDEVTTETKTRHEWTDWRRGYNNPKWRDQVLHGRNATTKLDGHKISFDSRPYIISENWTYDNPNGNPAGNANEVITLSGREIFSDIDDLSVINSEPYVQANNQAITAYVKKARKVQTTFQGGTFVAELGQTIRMLKRPFHGITRNLNDYLRQLKKAASRRRFYLLNKREKAEILSETWLEYQFGLKPLFNDLDEGTQALAERIKEGPKWVHVKGVGSTKREIPKGIYNVGIPSPTFQCQRHSIVTATVKFRGVIDPGSFSAMDARRIGFDPSNWAPTLWEIVPWSFLVDYVSNIGDIISAATFARQGERWLARTVQITDSDFLHSWSPLYIGDTGGGDYKSGGGHTSPGKLFVHKKKVARDAQFRGSLIPTLEISIPNTGTKWLNIAALSNLGTSVADKFR